MRTVRAPALRFHSDMSITVGKPYDDFGIGTPQGGARRGKWL
jgi:hypothetical protein